MFVAGCYFNGNYEPAGHAPGARRGTRMTKIRGNRDGPGRRNESYKIGSRQQVSRTQAVREVEQGKHPGAHTVKIKGRKYVRDNPDKSKIDNVNEK
ncbi:MAG: DUF3892 domain-containing protein [Woeseia sp.]